MGFQTPAICVDTHVHRISNRWRYVRTKTPEDTEFALRRKLPKAYWLVYNDLSGRPLGRTSVSRSPRSVDNARWLDDVRRWESRSIAEPCRRILSAVLIPVEMAAKECSPLND